jgi:hypothetical protein
MKRDRLTSCIDGPGHHGRERAAVDEAAALPFFEEFQTRMEANVLADLAQIAARHPLAQVQRDWIVAGQRDAASRYRDQLCAVLLHLLWTEIGVLEGEAFDRRGRAEAVSSIVEELEDLDLGHSCVALNQRVAVARAALLAIPGTETTLVVKAEAFPAVLTVVAKRARACLCP